MALRTFFLLALAFVVVLADECEDASYAPSAAQAVSSQSGNLPRGNNFQSACDILADVLGSYLSRWRANVYYGLNTGNYYAVMDCRSPAFAAASFCSGVTNFVFAVRDSSEFDDSLLHYYHLNEEGGLSDEPFASSEEEFDTTNQPWYVKKNGWTNPYEFSPSGIRGTSYASSFTDGVAGADRLPGEPCGPCLTGSYPVPLALSYGTGDVPDGAHADSLEEVEAMGKYLLSILTAMTNEVIVETYAGYENNYFYDIGDCRSSTQDCSSEDDAVWVMYSRNDGVFENDKINTLYLDADGNILTDPTYDKNAAPYFPTQRPWYVQTDGWAPSFLSLSTDIYVRTFSASFNGGVAACEIQLGPEATCVNGRNGLYEGSAEKLLLSLSLVLLAMFFALF